MGKFILIIIGANLKFYDCIFLVSAHSIGPDEMILHECIKYLFGVADYLLSEIVVLVPHLLKGHFPSQLCFPQPFDFSEYGSCADYPAHAPP